MIDRNLVGLNLPSLSSDHFQMGYNAANAVSAARAIGKGIDKNFGMVCFDDNNLLINLRLNINTDSIIQDSFRIGYTAAKLLIDQLSRGAVPASRTIVPLLSELHR